MEGLVYCYMSKERAAVFLEFPGQNLSFLQGPSSPTCCSCGLLGDQDVAEQAARGLCSALWIWLPVHPVGSTDITPPKTYPFHLGPLSPSVSFEPHKWAHPQISERHKQNNKVKSTWWWKTQGETWSQYFRSVRFMHWTIRQVTQGGVHIFTYWAVHCAQVGSQMGLSVWSPGQHLSPPDIMPSLAW